MVTVQYSNDYKDDKNEGTGTSAHILYKLEPRYPATFGFVGTAVSFFEITQVGQFMRLNSLTFTGSKVEEKPQELRKAKAEELVNLKQGRITVKEVEISSRVVEMLENDLRRNGAILVLILRQVLHILSHLVIIIFKAIVDLGYREPSLRLVELSQPYHIPFSDFRNFPSVRVVTRANNILVATSSAPTLKGDTSSFGTGRICLYALATFQESEGAKYFSKIDFWSGYHQLKIRECHYLYGAHIDVNLDDNSLQYVFSQKELNLRKRRCLELLMNYDMSIHYYSGKANVVANSVSNLSVGSLSHVDEEKLELCVLNIDGLRGRNLAEAHESRYTVYPGSMKMYYDLKEIYWLNNIKWDVANFMAKCMTLEDMLRFYVLDFSGSWVDHLPLIEFVYNNSYHARIGMAPFEALYGRRGRFSIGWFDIGEVGLYGTDLVHRAIEKVKVIWDRLKTIPICQKSYADAR
ncbi:hypothetical protein FXO38_04774 [Capsicum annuum]|nr:hypothetical protein FXO38_04774 [Capsicum annuum]